MAHSNYQFVNAVEKRQYHIVQHQLYNGQSVESNYLGVTPLSMAVEEADLDMIALLMHWKAKTDAPMRIAERYLANAKHKHHAVAGQMLELMNDPEAVAKRIPAIFEAMRGKEAEEKVMLKRGTVSLIAIASLCAVFYYYVLLPMQQSNDPKEL